MHSNPQNLLHYSSEIPITNSFTFKERFIYGFSYVFFYITCLAVLFSGCTRVWDTYEEPNTTTTLSGAINSEVYTSPIGIFRVSLPKTAGSLKITDNIISIESDEGQVFFTEVTDDYKRITTLGFTPANTDVPPDCLPPLRELMTGPGFQMLVQPFDRLSGFQVVGNGFVNLNGDEQYWLTLQTIRAEWCNPDAQADYVAWAFLVGRHAKGSVVILIQDMPTSRLKFEDLDQYAWDDLKQAAYDMFLSFH